MNLLLIASSQQIAHQHYRELIKRGHKLHVFTADQMPTRTVSSFRALLTTVDGVYVCNNTDIQTAILIDLAIEANKVIYYAKSWRSARFIKLQ